MRVVVVGATGAVGKHVVEELLRSSVVSEVCTLSRRAPAAEDPKLDARVGEMRDLLESLSSESFDAYICCLGTTMKQAGSKEAFRAVDFDYVVAFGRAVATPADAVFAVVSSVGADAGSGSFYLRVKGEAEDALRGMEFRALHIFRPGLLDTSREESRPGEQAAKWALRALNPLLAGGLAKYRSVRTEVVARALVAAVSSGTEGTYIYDNREIARMT